MANFHVEHFGCRAARADGEALAGHLRAWIADEPSPADVVVVNTCSVTAEADRAARAFIRRTHRRNPAARIVVTGCYAQRAPEELASMPGVSAVVGNSHKALVPEIVRAIARSAIAHGAAPAPRQPQTLVPVASLAAARPAQSSALAAPIWADDRFAHSFLEEAPGAGPLAPGAQTRPNLKIQEGCGNRCTFCVIPQTRGPSRSLPRAVVLRHVEAFVAAGGKELVLSGINLGQWGRDLAGPERGSLAELVRAILESTALARLRLSSIEPMDWNAELIALLREFGGRRLARHAHLPLQSGSDAVLRRMHRRYRPWHYAARVDALRDAAGPALTLGADVMVGFPGETDREFTETVDFLRSLPFGYLHLFPFSPRPETPGWTLHASTPVAAEAVEERMATLRALAAEKTATHRRQFVGRTLDVLTLRTPGEAVARECTAALTDNFLPVEIAGRCAPNQLLRVRVRSLNAEAALECLPAEAAAQGVAGIESD